MLLKSIWESHHALAAEKPDNYWHSACPLYGKPGTIKDVGSSDVGLIVFVRLSHNVAICNIFFEDDSAGLKQFAKCGLNT